MSSSANDKLLVWLFNAQSVGTAEKRMEICNFVQDQNLTFFFSQRLGFQPKATRDTSVQTCAQLGTVPSFAHDFLEVA